jgi:murein DD-endopeptidase MepM/ murein hydrolase activator NlpD
MKKYVWAARTTIVVAGAALLTKGVLPHEVLFGRAGTGALSRELLHNEESPIHQLADSLQEQPVEVVLPAPQAPQQPVVRSFQHAVKKGATFNSLWREIGGSSDDVTAVLDALKDSGVNAGSLRVGEELAVTHADGEVVEVRKKQGENTTVILTRDDHGNYAVKVDKLKVLTNERRVTGTIVSSLGDSAAGLQIPFSLVDDFVDLFSNRVEFTKDIQPGDSFTVIYEDRVSEDGERLAPGAIKAASIQLSGKMLAVVRDVAKDGTVRYFDEKGSMPTKAFLRYPLKYSRISSMFAFSRFHPVLKISRPHNGVDFAAPLGTPVRTVGDGVVVQAGYGPSTGNIVRIKHNDRYTTEYMHLNSISKTLRKGSRVGRGDVIGTVGRTGLSSGVHLHFGLFDKGKYVDPMKAKIMDAPSEIRPPAAVMAMIEDLKKAHASVNVASLRTNAKKKA